MDRKCVVKIADLVCVLSTCSLGGNCMTTMIATCSVEKKYMDVRMHELCHCIVIQCCCFHHRRPSLRVGLLREWHW